MPWKDGYTISDERTLGDADIAWPGAARCCVAVTVDLSVASGADGITEADLATSPAQFGARGGLEQLIAVLHRHRVPATFAVPAVTALAWPATVRAIAEAGHEIAAEGFRHEDPSRLTRAEEAERIAYATETLTRVAGARPAGWYSLPRAGDPFAVGTISAHTMGLLLDAGYAYFGNSPADDIPHWWVSDFAARKAVLALPYYYHFDDQFFCMFPAKGTGIDSPDSLARNWRAEFDAQYKRGRMFQMTLHPMHAGWSHRLALLDRFLAHMTGRPGVWVATAGDCARHWAAAFPAATHLRLEPSIWQDHPGSLS
jgi:peptidoglycan/xylan/chitin deacetylase (PgdA/CDA1 family)